MVLYAWKQLFSSPWPYCLREPSLRVTPGDPRDVMTASTRWRLATALIAVGACDPAFEFEGTVKTPAGVPIQNATVSLTCGDLTRNRTVTDQNGVFRGFGIGWRGDECSIVAVMDRSRPVSHRIGDHCVRRPWHTQTGCLKVRLDVVLPWGDASSSVAPADPRAPVVLDSAERARPDP